jgi:probable DNA repair protein
VTDWKEQVVDGAIMLTVNQRLARHRLSEFQTWQIAHGNAWWHSPDILPITAWLARTHSHLLAAGLTHRHLVPDLLSKRTWKTIVENDASLTLLDVASAAQLAQQAWQLSCSWRCHNRQDQYLSVDQYTWQRWLAHYNQWLEDERCIDDAMLPDALTDLLAEPQMKRWLPRQIIIDGFLQMTTQLQEFFTNLQEAGIDVTRLERPPAAVVHQIAFDTDELELLGLARQMRTALECGDHPKLGLVVPDLQQRRSAVLRAFDRIFFPGQLPDMIRATGRPYDLSLGLPLNLQGVVVTALQLLDLCHASIKGADISSLLLSPYWLAAEGEAGQRQQMDRRLREQRIRSLSLMSCKRHLYKGSQLAKPITQLLDSDRHSETTLSAWALRFKNWLDLLGWPGQPLDSDEYQAVMAWLECLDDLQILDTGESININLAITELQTLTRERVFQLEMPNTPIQIMGRLESHGIDFDSLWIAGLDSEQWPPATNPSPFLAMAEQRACAIPEAAASTRLALAEQEFALWTSQTPNLYVSFARNRDGKQLDSARLPIKPGGPDLSSAADKLPLPDSEQYKVEHSPLHIVNTGLGTETFQDDYGPALPAGSEVAGGSRLFENQALCPFRAFALHRLAVRPLEEPGVGLDARQHGTVLHASLEKFWQLVKTHTQLCQMSERQIEDTVNQVVREALQDLSIAEKLRQLEQTRLSDLIVEWIINHELPRQAFEVQELELEQRIEHGGVVMNVILDRIDNVDGSLVVVDYKTGTNNKIKGWADERIVNPQLPLYVLTDKAIAAASFAQVATNKCRFIGIASDADLLPGVKTTIGASNPSNAADPVPDNWADWRLRWQAALDNVAVEVRQGLASVTPVHGACTYCELKPLCRIDEKSQDAVETDLINGEPAV